MKIEKENKTTKPAKSEVKKEIKEEIIEPEDLAFARKLAELKKTNKRIYMTEIAGEKILWRPLKRSEYKDMLNMEFPEGTSEEDKVYDRETFIAQHVILYPKDAADEIALAAEIITSVCMEKSGFSERNTYTYKEV